jgi:hypothetical protein
MEEMQNTRELSNHPILGSLVGNKADLIEQRAVHVTRARVSIFLPTSTPVEYPSSGIFSRAQTGLSRNFSKNICECRIAGT